MMRRLMILGVLMIALWAHALAVEVLLIRTGSYDNADAIAAALVAGGHTVTIVDDSGSGITIPATTQVVFLQGYVYSSTAAQVAAWLNQQGGRGVVTTEWAVWYTASGPLGDLLPVTTNYEYSYPNSVTYAQATADPVMNQSLPNSFSFSGYNGGVTNLTPKSGATMFYSENVYNNAGVAGWELSNGARAVSISAVAQADDSLNSPEFRQLLVNAVNWAAAGTGPCVLEGDVNGDGVVNDADLLIVLFNFGNSCP